MKIITNIFIIIGLFSLSVIYLQCFGWVGIYWVSSIRNGIFHNESYTPSIFQITEHLKKTGQDAMNNYNLDEEVISLLQKMNHLLRLSGFSFGQISISNLHVDGIPSFVHWHWHFFINFKQFTDNLLWDGGSMRHGSSWGRRQHLKNSR